MPTAPRLTPPRPSPNLAQTDLPVGPLTALTYYRLVDTKYPEPLFWARKGWYRFDSPSAKWGVCYTAESIPSAVQEIVGDAVRKGCLDYQDTSRLVVWSITVPADLRTLELAGPALTRIRATEQCFVSRYSLSQEWGRALMDHPAGLDGLLYIGRRCAKPCLGLFGDAAQPRPYQGKLAVHRHGLLVEWNMFWETCDLLKVAFTNLPSLRPPPTW